MKTVFRSLSSLLFLSMGIFLLNSVNELVESGGLPEGKYCSMDEGTLKIPIPKCRLFWSFLFELVNEIFFCAVAYSAKAKISGNKG